MRVTTGGAPVAPAQDSGEAAADIAEDGGLGRRAERTRNAILEATRTLFLERGYAGTRISNITDACGISRAGFYTYFTDKREVFNVLGETAYRDIQQVVGRWDALPRPCRPEDVTEWVRVYFAFMDEHGAFILSAGQSAPADQEFRSSSRRAHMRVAFLLGVSLRSRQAEPTDSPEALGLATIALLDKSWYHCRVQKLPVGDEDMIRTVAEMISQSIGTVAG